MSTKWPEQSYSFQFMRVPLDAGHHEKCSGVQHLHSQIIPKTGSLVAANINGLDSELIISLYRPRS